MSYFSFKRIESFFKKGIKDKCASIVGGWQKKIYNNDVFRIHKMKSYLKKDDKKEIENIYLNTSYDDIFNFKIDNKYW